MNHLPVIIAGGGIGGLATALTLHQIGIDCLVLESVAELQPLGVGINIQPNAVRELYDLGLDKAAMGSIGVECQEWALVGLNGNEIYAEPRGCYAGYKWPQYSVHRGKLQMALYHAALERLGSASVRLGHRVTGYSHSPGGKSVLVHAETRAGQTIDLEAAMLVAADGIHSAVRAQMYPQQPPVHWGGAVMWRGTCQYAPIRTGASFVGLGTPKHRLVFYPITPADPATGLATINWIAEVTRDNSEGLKDGDWNKQVAIEDVVTHFADWQYDWLDVPDLLRKSSAAYEYPMIDRDPVPSWVDGKVVLLGDAAHAMYPVGSNGASQAIVDARVLGACLVQEGINPTALQAFDQRLCSKISALVLRNREAGPFGILDIVDERCGGVFEQIEQVLPRAEIDSFMASYKAASGFALEALNSAPPTIAPQVSRSPSHPAESRGRPAL